MLLSGSFRMILTTHAIVGAALASFMPSHPAAAFVVGFASHFALDAILVKLRNDLLGLIPRPRKAPSDFD
jgi:hypothetical protein